MGLYHVRNTMNHCLWPLVFANRSSTNFNGFLDIGNAEKRWTINSDSCITGECLKQIQIAFAKNFCIFLVVQSFLDHEHNCGISISVVDNIKIHLVCRLLLEK
ncbi:hypothetical protein OR221_2656, partial [Microbacterium laevaniformans OR221]